jgi:hypothetical protein
MQNNLSLVHKHASYGLDQVVLKNKIKILSILIYKNIFFYSLYLY